MSTFPDNTHAKFTTLLTHPIQLMRDWEVAIVEMSWPSLVQNVFQGNFSYQFINSKKKMHRHHGIAVPDWLQYTRRISASANHLRRQL